MQYKSTKSTRNTNNTKEFPLNTKYTKTLNIYILEY